MTLHEYHHISVSAHQQHKAQSQQQKCQCKSSLINCHNSIITVSIAAPNSFPLIGPFNLRCRHTYSPFTYSLFTYSPIPLLCFPFLPRQLHMTCLLFCSCFPSTPSRLQLANDVLTVSCVACVSI